MIKQTIAISIGFILGILVSMYLIFFSSLSSVSSSRSVVSAMRSALVPKQVIGFLPYWLLSKADTDYSRYITTLSYFALRIDESGEIMKLSSPQQEEPGWYTLKSGKVDPFLERAKKNSIPLSLVVDSGDIQTIDAFVASPSGSAKNLATSVLPILTHYGFSDLNLDIEYTHLASSAARLHFTEFVQSVRESIPKNISLTLEISPSDAIQQSLIDVARIASYCDHIVLMSYDYHSSDSFVTGPVAPLLGAGTESEYDVATAVAKTLALVPSGRLLLGIPLYGYEWETLGTIPRSAVIPGSGIVVSGKRADALLTSCATCSATLDKTAEESYASYLSLDSQTNHLLFFPTQKSVSAKIDLANESNISGLALWALGYEGKTLLQPLAAYK